MDSFTKIVGLPNDKFQEIYTSGKNYGLAIFNRGAEKWKYYVGSFPFLYGIYDNLEHTNKIHNETNNMLIKERRTDLDDNYHACIFFNIDKNRKPVKIIDSFHVNNDYDDNSDINFIFLDKEELSFQIILNISYLYDEYHDEDNDFRIPILKF